MTRNDIQLPARSCSFDLFDTLVFRAGLEPDSIWHDMARDFGGHAFVAARRHAAVQSPARSIQEIYVIVAAILGWGNAQLSTAIAAEMEAELTALHPITRMVRVVRPHDIVVSDMYLPRDFLQRVLLEKCGLHNRIVVTSAGKASGTVWDTLSPRPAWHIGDNPVSDADSPMAHQIQALLVNDSQLTGAESIAEVQTHRDVALSMRFARLQCPYNDGTPRALYDSMTQVTLPFLVRCASAVLSQMQDTKRRCVVLFSRDCCYLYHLMTRLCPHVDVRMLFVSRFTLKYGDAAWDRYFDSVVTDPDATLLIDMQGTGKSYRDFCARRRWGTRGPPPLVFLTSEHMSEILNMVPFGTCVGVDEFAACAYPRCLSVPVMEAFVAALRYFEIRRSSEILWKSCEHKIPVALEVQRCAILNLLEYFHVSGEPLNVLPVPVETEHAKLFMSLQTPHIQYPPAYVISNKRDRREHTLKLLKTLGINDVRVVEPHPANEATRMQALELLQLREEEGAYVASRAGPAGVCSLTMEQASHLLTYTGILDGAREPYLFIFEDDIVPLLSYEEVAFQLLICTCALSSSRETEIDAVFLEWCFAHAGPCRERPTFTEHVTDAPRDGNAWCTAATLWSRARWPAIRDAMVLGVQEELLGCRVEFEFADPSLATDALIQRARVAGDLRAIYHGPLFEQAVEDFGSSIEGLRKTNRPICTDRPCGSTIPLIEARSCGVLEKSNSNASVGVTIGAVLLGVGGLLLVVVLLVVVVVALTTGPRPAHLDRARAGLL